MTPATAAGFSGRHATPDLKAVDQSILALIAFTFSAGMTPGPNNIMLMTSGVNYGFRRTIPHMAGVALGFPLMVAVLGIGFGATIVTLPWFHDLVSLIGIPYILWLSWHIAAADTGGGLGREAAGSSPALTEEGSRRHEAVSNARPMSFLGASAFQWVNAKAWVMAVGMLALYAPRGYGVAAGISIVVAVNIAIAVLSSITWTAFGSILASWLDNPRRLRVFNITMAVLLAATLASPIMDLLAKYR